MMKIEPGRNSENRPTFLQRAKMKLFDCTECLTTLRRRRESQRRRSCETTDPLVTTIRPPSRRPRLPRRKPRSKTRRLLAVMHRFSASWERGRGIARSKLEARPRPKKKLLARIDRVDRSRRVGIPKTFNRGCLKRREIASVETSGDDGQEDEPGAGRRAGELEREYYEHLETLKFLIDPPPCFRNTETRQNFENKLNSLDFRRMNTVAIPEGPLANGHRDARILRTSRDRESSKTLDRLVKEHLRIERTMIDLFVRAPILKTSHDQPFARENKTVRFKDEVERSATSAGRWGESEGLEGVGSNVKMELTRKEKDVRRDGSKTFDVETKNVSVQGLIERSSVRRIQKGLKWRQTKKEKIK